MVVGVFVAPLVAGMLYDQAGDYQLVLWIVMGLALLATVVALVSLRERVTPLVTA